jgi:cell division protein FtsZ
VDNAISPAIEENAAVDNFAVDNANYRMKIKIIGVGGAGNNTINRIYNNYDIENVELIAINTDLQDLKKINADKKIIIGEKLTGGLGTGFYPEIGRLAIHEDEDKIREVLQDTDLLYVVSGLGGGTGTGATPEILKIAKELEVVTIAIPIMPFSFEGQLRNKIASNGLKEIKEIADTYMIVANNILLDSVDEDLPTEDAFLLVDNLLCENMVGLTKLLMEPGLINIDFADFQRIIRNRNALVYLGYGFGSGESSLEEAVNQATNTPFIENKLSDVSFAIVHLTINNSTSLRVISEIQRRLIDSVGRAIDVVMGVTIDPSLQSDELIIRIIATELNSETLI